MTDLSVRLAVLVAAVVVAALLGAWWRSRQGRSTVVDDGDRLTAADLGAALGERATLLQVSSAFCAPCRQARAVLSRLAASAPGVAHVEVDAAERLDLVRRLDVSSTPTVLVLDAEGRVVRRATGAPTPAQAAAALAAAVPPSPGQPGAEAGRAPAGDTRRDDLEGAGRG